MCYSKFGGVRLVYSDLLSRPGSAREAEAEAQVPATKATARQITGVRLLTMYL